MLFYIGIKMSWKLFSLQESTISEDTIEYNRKLSVLSKVNLLDETEYDDYSLQVYKMTGKDLIELNPSLYKNQRIRTDGHVKNIANGLYGRKLFHHNIILVNNKETQDIEIYDGQHRLESLKLKGKTIQSKIDCFVHVYNVSTDDTQFLQELYNEINVVKGNTEEEKEEQHYASHLAKELQIKFGTYYSTSLKIVDTEKDKMKYEDKWRLSYHELKQELEKRKIKKSPQECYTVLSTYNKECIRKASEPGFFERYKMNNKTMREKCIKYEFFLGICLHDALEQLV